METVSAVSPELDPQTLSALQAWISNPHPSVGNNSCPLTTAPASVDTAGMSGAKSQVYTTWNCCNRSLVGGFTLGWDPKQIETDPTLDCDMCEFEILTTVSALPRADQDKLTPVQRAGIKKGNLIYVPRLGLMRPDQLEQKKKEFCSQLFKIDKSTQPISPETFDYKATVPATSSDEAIESELCEAASSEDDCEVPVSVNKGHYSYSDTLPVRCYSCTSWKKGPNPTEEPPLTPFFNTINERLSDSSATTALMTSLRGPTVRDTASIAALARFLKHAEESFKEVAALTRVQLIGASVDKYQAMVDTTIQQVFRRFKYADVRAYPDVTIVPYTAAELPVSTVMAAPLDIAVAIALNKYPTVPPANFQYANMDTNWCMVPVRQTALSCAWIVPYIFSFLDSCYWNGTVNWAVDGELLGPDFEPQADNKVRYTTVPSCNSVRIPGPTHVMLVLVDSTAATSYSQISLPGFGNFNIPVLTGNRAIVPVNLLNLWTQFWTQNQIDYISAHCAQAFNELCNVLGVQDTCGLAISAAAEAMLHTRPGVGSEPNDSGIGYLEQKYGAWTYNAQSNEENTGGAFDKPNGQFLSKNIRPFIDKDSLRKLLIGFNFAGVSPMHFLSTGISKTTYNVNAGKKGDYYYKMTIRWSNCGSQDHPIAYEVPKYILPTTSSLMRLSIFAGLVSTHQQGYLFKSGPAIANFVSMQAMALMGSTCLLLSASDLDMRGWLGTTNLYNSTLLGSLYQHNVKVATQYLAVWSDVNALNRGTGEWAWDMISTYYELDPFTSLDMYSFSPTPIHFFQQWFEKLKIHEAPPQFQLETDFQGDGTMMFGVTPTAKDKLWKSMAFSSIDFHRYSPNLWVLPVGAGPYDAVMWTERWNYDSSLRLGVQCDQQYFESSTWLQSEKHGQVVSTRPTRFIIKNCRLSHKGDLHRLPRVSSVMYPDPPSLGDFLAAAKDYLLEPALVGGLTMLTTGNPVLAGAVGAGTVAKNLITNTRAHEHESKIRAAATTSRETQKAPPQPIVEPPTSHPDQKQDMGGPEGLMNAASV